jgi:hypothetical protein
VHQGVGDGQLVAPLALVVGGRGNDLRNQLLRRLAQNPCRLASGVEVDGAALWRDRFARNARGLQCRRVGDGDVSVDAPEKCGMALRNCVEFLPRGQCLVEP